MEYDKNGMNFSDLPTKGKYIDWKNSIGKYIYILIKMKLLENYIL